MKLRPTTLLWSTADGIECRIAPYEGDRYQLMLRWNDQTIEATVVSDYARALSVSREWRCKHIARHSSI
jgi:hypothetical protein